MKKLKFGMCIGFVDHCWYTFVVSVSGYVVLTFLGPCSNAGVHLYGEHNFVVWCGVCYDFSFVRGE